MYDLDAIVARAKRKGFVYPGSDIYGGLANARDYGPYGVQLKKNIQDLRWKTFVQTRPDMVGLDAQILMHPKVWETSGHVDNFDDPLIDDKVTGERFRADKIIEDKLEAYRKDSPERYLELDNLYKVISAVSQEIDKRSAALKDGVQKVNINLTNEVLDKIKSTGKANEIFVSIATNLAAKKDDENAKRIPQLRDAKKMLSKQAQERLQSLGIELELPNLVPESRPFEMMHEFIVAHIPNNPNSKKGKEAEWTEVRKFQMMFYTYQGVVHDAEDAKIWLRPETAQGIFVNFRNVLDTTRMRVPFGIAQIGKAFRNEITPGNFLYRTREFEQMEIEYFVSNDKDKAMESFAQWKDDCKDWFENKIKLDPERIRFREHESDELSHYSDGTFDVEFEYPWGWGELQGIAYRTDFDLSRHQEESGKNMQYNDPFTGERYIPHVIEPSFGLSRMTLAVMLDAYDEEQYTNGKGDTETRTVARFAFDIAPVKFAIFPLIKKDEDQVRIAKEIFADLSQDYLVEYDDGGAIGKRYRRQDEIGTPYCITVDPDSVSAGTVTIRDRDSMDQQTVQISEIRQRLDKQNS